MRALIVTEEHKVQRKPHLPVAFYLVIRYNEFWMRKTQGLFSLCKMKTGERWI